MIEKMIIEVKELQYQNSKSSYVTSPYEVIRAEDIDKFRDYIKTLKLGELSKGKTNVFFNEGVIYPRRKFNECYPDMKIVRDEAKADVVIVDTKALEMKYTYIYTYNYYKCHSGSYSTNPSDPERDGTNPIKLSYHTRNMGKLREDMNSLYAIRGKNIIDVTKVDISTNGDMDYDVCKKLDNMLGARDTEMNNMALNMLTSFSYSKDKYKIVLLLSKNFHQWWGNRKLNVEIKSLLRKLDLDFPTYRIPNNIGMWLKCTVNSNDLIVRELFLEWLRKYYPECPDIKIVAND